MGDAITRPAEVHLSDEHREFLSNAAVDVDLALALGVRTVTDRADMEALEDPNWENFANFPAILFPWTSPDGRVMYQARPDNPTEDQRTKKLRKYVFGRGDGSILWAVRPVATAEKIVIIEGTKQGLAGASYAPPGVGIYSIAGIRNWQVDGRPIRDLAVADGREVVIIPDADAGENPQVYEACMSLAETLGMEGSTKVTFARLPGGASKSGLDDILAGRDPERRAAWLARLIEQAKTKPAETKPKPPRKNGATQTEKDGRAMIVVNRDRLLVINELTDALLKKWNGRELFCHGGVISRRRGDTMAPVDKGTFNDIVQATAMTVNENEGAQGTTHTFAWPDAGTMMATMSRADQFARLDRIAHAPFARPDGTICTEPGYDEATQTLLLPDEVFAGLQVPESPTAEEVTAARELLLTEWLGDFPLDDAPDKANLLGLLVTPAIRGMVPRAPLAVIDGLQMGVGKNLLVDSLLTVYTGHAAQPMNWVSEPDELRKQITAAFRQGSEFFVFDEAHTLEGAPLAQALTAETWQDRILGVSTMANFPNRVTWISLGNNVQVKGDITRRVYRIALRPTYANPQDRAASSFRHPGQSGLDLGSWTRKHRRELLTAILTLVRAWFANGSPYPRRGVSFGSFEVWERTVGGIVENAGLEGFLGNLKVWRSESDFDTQYWISHLAFLREQFSDEGFRTSDVKAKALTLGTDLYSAPPRLDDPTEKTYGKALGEAYSRISGRRYGALWMERAGSAHGHVSLWRVHEDEMLPPFPPGEGPPPPPMPEPEPLESGPDGPTPVEPDTEVSTSEPDAQPVDEPVDEPVTEAEEASYQRADLLHEEIERTSAGLHETHNLITLDLETGDAGEQYTADPATYVRIGATAADGGEVTVYDRQVPESVVLDMLTGRVSTGHNIMAFDLPVMVRAGALGMDEVHRLAEEGKLFDALLAGRFLDPPMAKDKGVDQQRRYDLGTLAAKYTDVAKLSDISKELAKTYGGWNGIPYDLADPDEGRAADAARFREYLVGDVQASRKLYAALLAEFGGTVPEYVQREHRVAALATQISVNGFLVNKELLAQRVEEIQRRKAEALDLLVANHGIPRADGKGKAYKSPLASKAGKDALEKSLREAGVPEKGLWRTPNSGDLQVSAESMLHIGREYGHLPGVTEIAKAVYRIVSARSIYETVQNSTQPDGRVHPKISFAQATGRWSLTDPGLTVMGKRGGRHVERAVLLPDPGEALVSFDLSQVDMRAVAGLSGDAAYIEMLLKEDPHAELAELLLGDRSLREMAKPIGHGWNYGRGVKAICQANSIDPAIGWKFDASMRERFGRLVEWQDEVRALAEGGHLLDNGFGRLMRPDPHRAYTQGPALMGQGAARDIMMTGMLRLPEEARPMLRAQVHDEIVLSIPVKQVDRISRSVVEALSFEWKGVPILADRSPAGSDWSKCYEKA